MTLSIVEHVNFGRALDRAPDDLLKFSATARAIRQTRGENDELAREVRRALTKGRLPGRIQARLSEVLERNGSIRDRAALDYCRPYLANAIQVSLDTFTPRYTNEAARKNFYKQLSSFCSGIHLSPPEQTLIHLKKLDATDPITQSVKQNLENDLADPKASIQAFKQKSQRLNDEIGMYLLEFEELTGADRKTSERFIPDLDVTSFFDPEVIEDEKVFGWGVSYDRENRQLILNPSVVVLDALRQGVLAREAALLLTPAVMEQVDPLSRAMHEQAEYLAYKVIESKRDKQFWFQARHGLRTVTLPRAEELLDFFQYYEMLVGPSLYHDLWSRLLEVGQRRITVNDYRIIFQALASRPTRPDFSKKELELADLFIRQPDISVGDTARALKTTIPTAAKMISQLTMKASLLFTALIDITSLGLQEYDFFIRSSRVADAISVFSRIPFCRQLYRTYGSMDLFGVIDLPGEHSNFIFELLSMMESKGLISEVSLGEAHENFQSVNFNSFGGRLGKWDLHWDTWGVALRDELRRAAASREETTEVKARKFKVERIDFLILDILVGDCRRPFAEMARDLGVSGAYVGQRIRKMRDERVYRPAIWPLKAGAEDLGLIEIECEARIARTIAHFLDSLPSWRGSLLKGPVEGLVALVWVPSGELKQFFKAIDDRVVNEGYSKKCTFQSLGEWVVGRWLPVGPYPHPLLRQDGTWEFDAKKYLGLIR